MTQEAYKEFEYLNSHTINIDFQVAVCRLELPRGTSKCVPSELYLTTHIVSNNMSFHEVALSTNYGTLDRVHGTVIWDAVVEFPSKFRDLKSNSMLIFTAWTSEGDVFGGASMKLFDKSQGLKRGKQKVLFFFDRPGASFLASYGSDDLYRRFAIDDEAFHKEKLMECYKFSQATRSVSSDQNPDSFLDWLDRLTIEQLRVADSVMTNNPACMDLHSYAHLVVSLPILPHYVLFGEKCAPAVTPHTPRTSFEMLSVKDGPRTAFENDSGDTIYEFNLTGRNFAGQCLQQVVDWDMELDADNPCEEVYRRLAHDSIRGRGKGDQAFKPNLQDKDRLEKILHTPGDHLKTEEKDFLYRFRYVLTENKMALPKFLLSVDWSSEGEVSELPCLLDLWKQKAPIDVADALKLLSGGKAFQSPIVRKYAVDVLRNATDDEIQMLLLQLVQALRYEPEVDPGSSAEFSSSLSDQQKHCLDRQLAGSQVEENSPVSPLSNNESTNDEIPLLSPLGQFLVERSCSSTTVANFFYWYLKVETEDATVGGMFQNVLDVFLHHLRARGGESALLERRLRALNEYIDTIISCQKAAREVKGKKDVKEASMRAMLAENDRKVIPDGLESVPLPLDPTLSILSLDPKSIVLFRSAMYPALIDFKASKSGALLPQEEVESSPDSQSEPITYKIIFKSGDDLRQDQLVMQLISLMDSLLKKVNLDLGLLTYGILATGPTDGIMEFVRNSMPISAVLSSFGNSLSAYLKHHNPDPHSPYGVKPETMDMFVRSCAASCVVTFILGIGDRHLDNIMLRTNGQMFHIDFGFIFGRDPKPLPPPFRFTRAMADAMGGEDSEHYKRFQSYCCQAYNWLRKSANLILNMLSLMINASIPDLSVHEDPFIVLKKVEEKFRLDLTDEQAEAFFLGLINESLTALAPRLMELAHQIAVARR